MQTPKINLVQENGGYIEALSTAVRRGGSSLDNLPDLLIQVVSEGRWQRYYDRASHREVVFGDFTAFVETGLNTSIAMLKRMCSDNTQALDALDKALQGKSGAPIGNVNASKTTVDNVHSCLEDRPTGNSADAAIRRLRTHAIDRDTGEILDPKINELYEAVLSGEMSPNAAAIEAGFRKRMISIPADDADRAARSIRSNMLPETIARLVERLEGAY